MTDKRIEALDKFEHDQTLREVLLEETTLLDRLIASYGFTKEEEGIWGKVTRYGFDAETNNKAIPEKLIDIIEAGTTSENPIDREKLSHQDVRNQLYNLQVQSKIRNYATQIVPFTIPLGGVAAAFVGYKHLMSIAPMQSGDSVISCAFLGMGLTWLIGYLTEKKLLKKYSPIESGLAFKKLEDHSRYANEFIQKIYSKHVLKKYLKK